MNNPAAASGVFCLAAKACAARGEEYVPKGYRVVAWRCIGRFLRPLAGRSGNSDKAVASCAHIVTGARFHFASEGPQT